MSKLAENTHFIDTNKSALVTDYISDTENSYVSELLNQGLIYAVEIVDGKEQKLKDPKNNLESISSFKVSFKQTSENSAIKEIRFDDYMSEGEVQFGLASNLNKIYDIINDAISKSSMTPISLRYASSLLLKEKGKQLIESSSELSKNNLVLAKVKYLISGDVKVKVKSDKVIQTSDNNRNFHLQNWEYRYRKLRD